MAYEWLIEFLKGTGKMFLHPVFYYLFIIAIVLGITRVKREREQFHVRAQDAFFEARQLLPLGMLIGLGLSVISVAAGIVIPMELLVSTATITFLLSLTAKIRLMSPAYTIGLAFLLTIFAIEQKWPLPSFLKAVSDSDQTIFPSIAVLLALLIVSEGLLIYFNGWKGTSPKLAKSKRGKAIGIHEVNRLWLVPIFLLVPGDAIKDTLEWWPVFSGGGNSYSIILVPFSIGFYQRIQGLLPKIAVRKTGQRVLRFGILVLLLSIIGYWLPLASLAVITFAIIGREYITMRQTVDEENQPFYFSKRNKGLMILGIIPDSPASNMGLQIGEIITKVNGISVRDNNEFYEALLKNRAQCKLEVIDVNGQIRFTQRALYEGDHHELGVLIVHDERKKGDEAV